VCLTDAPPRRILHDGLDAFHQLPDRPIFGAGAVFRDTADNHNDMLDKHYRIVIVVLSHVFVGVA